LFECYTTFELWLMQPVLQTSKLGCSLFYQSAQFYALLRRTDKTSVAGKCALRNGCSKTKATENIFGKETGKVGHLESRCFSYPSVALDRPMVQRPDIVSEHVTGARYLQGGTNMRRMLLALIGACLLSLTCVAWGRSERRRSGSGRASGAGSGRQCAGLPDFWAIGRKLYNPGLKAMTVVPVLPASLCGSFRC
jgi:hypothetical protein